jgi:hypothetical protein
LHSWPDKSLGSRAVLHRVPDPAQFHTWLQQSWSRISEWPVSPALASAPRSPLALRETPIAPPRVPLGSQTQP